MKVETKFGEEEKGKRAGEKRNGGRLLSKRGYGRRTRRRVQPASMMIQELFLACKTAFKGGPGTVPEPADVEKLQLLLDKMKPEDVGLSTDTLLKVKGSSKGTPRIAYAVIYQCDYFSICIFIMPPRAVIPLHNHPGMTVFSKLLLGSMHIKSYDWLSPAASVNSIPSAKLIPAKLVLDSDFTAPCDTSILYPSTGGNIHTLTAITTCALLDVQGPPYSKEEGRDITYYRDHPYWKFPNDHTTYRFDEIDLFVWSVITWPIMNNNEQLLEETCLYSFTNYFSTFTDGATNESGEKACSLGWLEEVDISEELKMDGVPYRGPQVIDV